MPRSLKYPFCLALSVSCSAALGCTSGIEATNSTSETSTETGADIAVSTQQLRAGSSTIGETFLGVDVLTTLANKGKAAIWCDESTLSVDIAYSLDGADGTFIDLPNGSIELGCGTPGGDFALVVDNSGSEGDFLNEVKHAARAVIQRVLSAGGRAGIVRVSTDATVLSEVTDDRAALEGALNGMYVNRGWTALYDGIRMGNETLSRAASSADTTRYGTPTAFCTASSKLGVVVITDGGENNSSSQRLPDSDDYPGDGHDTSLDDLMDLTVSGISTPIYTIGLGDKVDHDSLAALAEHTGGRHLRIDRNQDIQSAFDAIGDYALTRHQACMEVPADVCGPVHVRVRHTLTASLNGWGKKTFNGERIFALDVPCAQ